MPLSSQIPAPQIPSPEKIKDVVTLSVRLNFDGQLHKYAMDVHLSREVSEILKRVVEWFKREVCPKGKYESELSTPQNYSKHFQFLFKSTCLNLNMTLTDAGIKEDCELQLICLFNDAEQSLPKNLERLDAPDEGVAGNPKEEVEAAAPNAQIVAEE